MPLRKEEEKYASVGVKDCWHPYGLQGLNPEKFALVATHILAGKFDLLMFRPKKENLREYSERAQLI
jgi:hypothetical protein